MKIIGKLLMVSVQLQVKVGGLECTAEYQVCRDLGSRDEVDDIDFIDITDISYLEFLLRDMTIGTNSRIFIWNTELIGIRQLKVKR